MPDRSFLNSAAKRRVALLFAAATLLLAGCASVTRIAYNNAAPLTLWYVDDYLYLSSAQKDWLRPRLDELVDWHRRSELPTVRTVLLRAQSKAAGPIEPGDVEALYAAARATFVRTTERILPSLADLLQTLTPEQIDQLEKKLAKDNAKIERDMARPLAVRLKERGRKLTDQAEDWLGSVSEEQQQALAELNARLPPIEAEWLADRKSRQQATLKLLRAKPTRDEMIAGLTRIFLQMETWRDPAYAEALRVRERAAFEVVATLSRTLTSAQRTTLQKRLGSYLDDVTLLLAAVAPAGGRLQAAATGVSVSSSF